MRSAALPLVVALPMLLGGLLIGQPWSASVRRAVLLGGLLVNLVAGTLLLAATARGSVLAHLVGGWPAAIAIPFVVDAFAALMLVLTGTLTLLVSWSAVANRAADEPYFAALVLLVTAGVNGALLTGDLFNLFVFIEIMLVPSYALLVLAHRGAGQRMQVTASRIYVTVNLLTSSVFLIGLALVYAGFGSVNLAVLSGRGNDNAVGLLGCLVLLFALSVKAAVVPMHGWLGRTYPHMSPTVSALFSGLHTKVAVYALFRLTTMFFEAPRMIWVGTMIFALSMAVGVVAALGQSDARAVLSFHMVSQIGYILLGLAMMTGASIAAGVYYLVHNVVAKGSLFLSVGAVEHRYGRHPIGEVRGLAAREPLTAVVFFVAAISLAGLPPFSGFVAKLAIITAAFNAGQWVVAVAALVVSLFTLMSMLKIWGGTFLGSPEPPMAEHEGPRIRRREIAPALILAVISLALGVYARPLLELTDVIAAALLDPHSYVQAVL